MFCLVMMVCATQESTPGRIRTFNPRFRRPMRYPIAPRTRAGLNCIALSFDLKGGGGKRVET